MLKWIVACYNKTRQFLCSLHYKKYSKPAFFLKIREINKKSRLDIAVSNEEPITRAVFHPFHCSSKGKLKTNLYKPPCDSNEISVNRLIALTPDECKERALKMATDNKALKGFATILTGSVRELESDVVDSRILYFGHADIIHPFVVKRGVSLPPEANLMFKNMIKMTRFYVDPTPEDGTWKGGNISEV